MKTDEMIARSMKRIQENSPTESVHKKVQLKIGTKMWTQQVIQEMGTIKIADGLNISIFN